MLARTNLWHDVFRLDSVVEYRLKCIIIIQGLIKRLRTFYTYSQLELKAQLICSSMLISAKPKQQSEDAQLFRVFF